MIARSWRGWTAADDADAYVDYLERDAMPVIRETPGNRGAYVLRRLDGEWAEFVTLTLWDGEEAVRAFAGDDPGRARFFPEDDRFLVERELHVTHYEVAAGP